MSRLPVGLLGMVAILGAVELTIHARRDSLVSPEHWAWRHASAEAAGGARGADLLCFGDSLVMMGVVPSAFEAPGGLVRSTYNLAVPGGQAPGSYFLLRRALESGARPSAVIVDFKPKLLDCDVMPHETLWPEILTVRDACDLAWAAGKPDLFGSILLTRAFPSLRAREEIRRHLAPILRRERRPRGERRDREVGLLTFQRNLTVNRGFGASLALTAPPTPEQVADWFRKYFPKPWSCHPTQETYVRRFLDLASSRGIAVYCLLPPNCPDAQRLQDESGDAERYAHFIRLTSDEYPGVVVLDARRSGFETGLFKDAVHMGTRGAAMLTEAIRDALTAGGAGTRWIDLSLDARRAPSAPLETFEASRVAVRSGIAAERARR